MAYAYEENLSCSVCLKCILDLQDKTSNQNVKACPICHVESIVQYRDREFDMKQYQTSFVNQAFDHGNILRETVAEIYVCEICDYDTSIQNQRICIDCEMRYCKACFNTCHPMKGKLGKHKILKGDESFQRQNDPKNDIRNMYCNDCDVILPGTDISLHKRHDVMLLREAHLIFKGQMQDLENVKLDGATGNVDVMQSTLKSGLDKSREKLKIITSIFEEAEVELARKKDEALSKLRADVNEAKIGAENLMSEISTYRELQSRTDTISFIEDCKKALQRPSLKHDFGEVRNMFDRIDKSSCSNKAVLKEIKKFEVCALSETDNLRITKLSHAIKGHRESKVLLEWTREHNADSYNVVSRVRGVTTSSASVRDTSCVLDDVDGTETTEMWISTVMDGRKGPSSACVTVPRVTLPNLLFDHQRAGRDVRVSRDETTMSPAGHADTLLVGHHPASTRGLRQARCVLGNRLTPTGLVYWQVEATRTTDDSCSFIFGVMSSVFLADEYPGAGLSSWGVDIECDSATTTLRMRHAGQRLHEEVCDTSCRQATHRCGLLLDVDNRSLSVIGGETSRSIFTFQNVETSKGVTPIYGVYPGSNYGILRLINPDEIENAPLLPFSVVHRDDI